MTLIEFFVFTMVILTVLIRKNNILHKKYKAGITASAWMVIVAACCEYLGIIMNGGPVMLMIPLPGHAILVVQVIRLSRRFQNVNRVSMFLILLFIFVGKGAFDKNIDVIFAEAKMSRVDGIALLHILKVNRQKLPVFILSNTEDDKYRAKTELEGTDGYLLRPFTGEQVEKAFNGIHVDVITGKCCVTSHFTLFSPPFWSIMSTKRQ